MQTDNRPLSPHLQIYRLPMNAVLSISHRITGIALSAGSLILVLWLVSAAAGPEAYSWSQALLGSIIGQLLIFVWTFALFYHLCNGIRHLFWDAGYGFDLTVARRSGLASLGGAAVLTLLAWAIALAG